VTFINYNRNEKQHLSETGVCCCNVQKEGDKLLSVWQIMSLFMHVLHDTRKVILSDEEHQS